MMTCSSLLLFLLLLYSTCQATKILDFTNDFGGIPEIRADEIRAWNARRLSFALRNASALLLRGTFYLDCAVQASHVTNLVLLVNGTLYFQQQQRRTNETRPPFCLDLSHSKNVTLTSVSAETSRRGILSVADDVSPSALLHIHASHNIQIEHLIVKNSRLYLDAVQNVRVRNVSIVTQQSKGLDVRGSNNVLVQDVDIWAQKECVLIRDSNADVISGNIMMERLNVSGAVGVSIVGSSASVIRNVTVRNTYVHKSHKGIGISFQGAGGIIENVLFQNVTMEAPPQWPLWMGPAQQANGTDPCAANPCSLCWPETTGSQCNIVPNTMFRNITLQNVLINNPNLATGVILANDDNAMDNIVFDSVRVTNGPPVLFARAQITTTFPGLKQLVNYSNIEENRFPLERKGTTVDVFRKADDLRSYKSRIAGLVLGILMIVGAIVTWLVLCYLRCKPTTTQQDESFDEMDVPGEVMQDDEAETASAVTELVSNISSGEIRLDDPLLLRRRTKRATTRRPTRVERSCVVNQYHVVAFFVALYGLLTGLSYVIDFPEMPEWKKTDRYYACEGVTNGVAKGNTWPVPVCFDNQTNIFSWAEVFDRLTGLVHAHFMLVACIVTVISLALHFAFLSKDKPVLIIPSENVDASTSLENC
jgi:hypothetical protein